MAITAIGSGSDAPEGAALAERLKGQLAGQIPMRAGAHSQTSAAAPAAQVDLASSILSQVSTNDLAKLSQILEPAATGENAKVLDSLLTQAISQVQTGNIGRAVGTLADYATRDPRGAETLTSIPELAPVRAQIDTLVGQMTNVARISAEDGLARAGHSAEELAGKLPNWDTKPETLVKLAQSLYDAGGYANYARSTELARAVTAAADSVNMKPPAALAQGPGLHTLQAMGAAQGSAAGVTGPGTTVPYIISPFTYAQELNLEKLLAPDADDIRESRRRARAEAAELARESWEDLKDVATQAFLTLWDRAPLLVMLLVWLGSGTAAGITFLIARHLTPSGTLTTLGNIGFTVWALGFLALVAFGFWARVRRPRY